MPKFCVKRPYTVVVAVVMVLVLGVISFMNMTTDLLPTIELPYVVVVTTYPGASPERVETSVTAVLEAGLGTVNGVADVSSISSENVSMIVLEFESGSNMDSAMVKLSTAVDQVKGYLPDTVGTPMLLELSPDMLPVMMASVDVEGMDIYELSQFTEDTVVPYFERQAGVASVDSIGLVEQTVEVRLDEAKIEAINTQVLAGVDEKLAEAKKELDDAVREVAEGKDELQNGRDELQKGKDELQKGKDELSDKQKELSEQLAQGNTELDSASARLNAMLAEKDSLTAEQQIIEAAQKCPVMREALLGIAQKVYDYSKGAVTVSIFSKALMDSATFQGLSLPEELAQAYVAAALQQNAETMVPLEEGFKALNPAAAVTLADLYTSVASAFDQDKLDELVKSQLGEYPENIEQALPKIESITAEQLAAAGGTLPPEMAGKSGADLVAMYRQLEGMVAMYGDDDNVTARAAEIESRLKVLALSEAQLQQALDTVKENQAKLEAGMIEAAAGFGSGSAQLAAAESGIKTGEEQLKNAEEQLKNAEEQLKEAQEQFEEAREEALKNADMTRLLTKEMLSNIILAQNFAMPAGYLYQDDDQYLLRVGDAFGSIEELKNALLLNMDLGDVGDIRLSDVATVTLIDNAGESYAKVNGNQAVVLSISKGSTAGTSDVSKALNAAIEELEAQHEGLRIAP